MSAKVCKDLRRHFYRGHQGNKDHHGNPSIPSWTQEMANSHHQRGDEIRTKSEQALDLYLVEIELREGSHESDPQVQSQEHPSSRRSEPQSLPSPPILLRVPRGTRLIRLMIG
jgi:hypothetical protein